MKHTKSVVVPARFVPGEIKEVYSHITCDLCGEVICVKGDEVDEVQVQHKTGYSYPEESSGETTIVDMCGKCFDEKLLPWLHSFGVKERTEDWDY